MVRNRPKRCIALLLSILLMACVPMSGGMMLAEEENEKISSRLFEAFSLSEEPLKVEIKMTISDLPYQDQASFEAAVLDYLTQWGLVDRERIIEPDDIWLVITWQMFLGRLTPEDRIEVVSLELTKDEVLRLAEYDQVAYLDGEYDEGVYFPSYDAQDALRILQISVKLVNEINSTEEWLLDIDQNGRHNASDALLALQHSVGLVTIAWAPGTEIPG